MINIAQGEWIADLGSMTCRNINNMIVVSFERKGKTLLGKIKDMPVELIQQWANIPSGHNLVRKAVAEAEEVFLRAYVQNNIEKLKI